MIFADFSEVTADPASVELSALVEELEAAGTTGSRQLDARIAIAIQWPGLAERINGQTASDWMQNSPGATYEDVAKHWNVPHFTLDFEAAQMALTGTWTLRLLRIADKEVDATIENDDGDEVVAHARTYALAISAAAVHAFLFDLDLD